MNALRNVDAVLQTCTTFWSHLQLTSQKAIQLRELILPHLKYASSKPRIRERFLQKLSGLKKFWQEFRDNSKIYCDNL